jgi:hypothetical protein
MKDAFQVIRFSLRDFWDEFVLLVMLSALWTLTLFLPSAPLFLLTNVPLMLVLVLVLLLALPLPIVSGAVCYVTNQVARGKAAGWGVFLTGVKRYWGKSLVVALVNLVALVLLAANFQFYGVLLEGTWTTFALAIWVLVTAYWFLVEVFWFPMILELQNEKLLLALRNALLMALVTPGFSLTLAVILIVLIVLCILLVVPAMLFMAALVLLICNHATRSRLAYTQKKPYQPWAEDA